MVKIKGLLGTSIQRVVWSFTVFSGLFVIHFKKGLQRPGTGQTKAENEASFNGFFESYTM